MQLLTARRISRHWVSRLLAAIFAIGWLGIAVAPCQAMPQLQHQGSHHGSMPAGDCGRCPSAAAGIDGGCATAAAPECALAGPGLFGYRSADLPQLAAGPPPAIPVFDVIFPDARPGWDLRAHRLPVSRVSIQQRYCTYLN